MTELKIVPFPDKTIIDKNLIDCLEVCLERAKIGKIDSFVLVYTCLDGSVLRSFGRSDEADVFRLLGVLEHESRHLSEIINLQNKITDNME